MQLLTLRTAEDVATCLEVLLQNYSRLHLPHVRRRLEQRLKELCGAQRWLDLFGALIECLVNTGKTRKPICFAKMGVVANTAVIKQGNHFTNVLVGVRLEICNHFSVLIRWAAAKP